MAAKVVEPGAGPGRGSPRRSAAGAAPARVGWRPGPAASGPTRGEAPLIDFIEAVVLGLLQGLTEFLPISSSAHLRIFPELLGWGDPGAAFTAVIQIGTELAVLIYFRQGHLAHRQRLGALAVPARLARRTRTPAWAGTSSSARCRSWSSGILLKDVIEQGLPQPVDHRHHADRAGRRARGRRPRRRHATAPIDRHDAAARHLAGAGPGAGAGPRRLPLRARRSAWAASSATTGRPRPGSPSCWRSRPSSAPGCSSSRRSRGGETPTAGADAGRDGRVVPRRVRRHRVAAALRHDPVLPAVRDLPDRARGRCTLGLVGTGVLAAGG